MESQGKQGFLACRMAPNAKAHFKGNSLLGINALYRNLYTDPNLRTRSALQFIVVEGGLNL